MSIVIIPLAIFLCVTAAVAAVAFQLAGSGKTEVEDRLAVLTGASSGKQAERCSKAACWRSRWGPRPACSGRISAAGEI